MRGVTAVILATFASVFLAEWLEIWYRFGATHAPELFVGALFPYTLMALAFHALLQVLPRWPLWVWLLIGAIPGMALEWVIIGNSPWGNPQASQLGMVLFHGAWPIWGRIFDRRWFRPDQRRAGLQAMGLATLALLPGFLIAAPDWRFAFFIWLPLLPYVALWVIALKPAKA
jgi:hypothetical protein